MKLLNLIPVLISTLCFLFSQTLYADSYRKDLPDANDNTGWDLVLEKNGAQIYTMDWEGSNYVALKAVQMIHSPLSNIVGNFTDASTYPEWANDLEESFVVEPFDESRSRKVYTRLGMPWPTSDRDVVFGQKFIQDPKTKTFRIKEWYEGNVLPEKKGVVRTLSLNIEFVFIPVSEDLTMMVWQGHNEPGGSLPPFIINWLVKDVFYSSAINLRERLETPAYNKAADWFVDF